MDIAFEYQITDPGVVLDVGSYNGEFIDYIRPKYGCGIHAFEPQREKFSNILKKYAYDPLVWPYNVALEDRMAESSIYGHDNGKSFYRDVDESLAETVRIRDIWDFIRSFKLPKIDILKMNCEGSEYPILERLASVGFLGNVRNIVVQFHFLQADMEERYNRIVEKLSETHERKFNCVNSHWEWWVSK